MAKDDLTKRSAADSGEEQPEFIDVKTDPLWPEIKLLFRRFSHDDWQERCRQWQTHVNVFARLNSDEDGEKANRIKYLFEHLGILDTKFNVLLTVNTLLLVAWNGLLNFQLNRQVFNKQLLTQSTGWLGLFFVLSWLITMVTCLIGERQLVWGDLGLFDKRHLKWDEFKSFDQFTDAEERHVKALIAAVAKRTNKFRVAIFLTYFNVAFLVIDLCVTVWKAKHS